MKLNKILLLIFFIFLQGCQPAEIAISQTGTNTLSYDEVIHMNNCGGKADSEQTVTQSFSTTIEGTGSIKAGYKDHIEGQLSAKYGEYRTALKSIKLVAPAGTDMYFTLTWTEQNYAGDVTVNGEASTYVVKVPLSVELKSSEDRLCNSSGMTVVTQAPTDVPFQPEKTSSPDEPTATTVVASKTETPARNLLFEENFEDGMAQNASYWEGGAYIWNVMKDEIGNWVYDGDNTAGWYAYPRVYWGSTAWKNYEIHLRFRFMNLPPEWQAGSISFRSSSSFNAYSVQFNPYNRDVAVDYYGGEDSYIVFDTKDFTFEIQEWYDLTITLSDENISVWIDGVKVLEIESQRRLSGHVAFVSQSGVHFQVDDIEVISLP